MIWHDAVRLAFSALRCAIFRTVLTILGLGVGVGAVLAVLTLGAAGENRVETEIARLGVDKVWIRSADSRHELLAADALMLRDATDSPACAGAYTAALVRCDDDSALTQIAGYDAALAVVHAPRLLEGRLFSAREYEQGSAVCLVDQAFAERIGGSVLGKWITVGSRRVRIVGVIKGMTMQAMSAGSGLVILPLGAYLETFGGKIAEITMSVRQGQQTREIANQALMILSNNGGFRADTLENEIDAAREIVRIFVMVLLCVAIVCMLTGSIGVMNVLLISVRERQREIGLLKAIGGTAGQVGLLFLLEAAAYAVLGGIFGVILGHVMVSVFSAWIGLDASLLLVDTGIVLLSASLLGCLCGVLPALKAASLQPVDALRSE